MKFNKLPENTDKKIGIDSKLFMEINEIIGTIKKLMEKKESLDKFEKITTQGQPNNKLYLVPVGTKIQLLKDGKQTIFETNEDTIIGESTFLAYLNKIQLPANDRYLDKNLPSVINLNKIQLPANATVEIKGKYYEIPFDKLVEELSKGENTEFKLNLIRFLKELEKKRKGKTQPVVR